MAEPQIGQWVKRKGAFRRHVDENGNERWTGPRWHVVESVVSGDAVVRCGKRLVEQTQRGGLEVSEVMPLTRMIGQPQLCNAGCDRPGMVVRNNEDDASTHDETVP